MKTSKNKLKIHPGKRFVQVVHPYSIRRLTDATWHCMHHILWSGYPFGKAEIMFFKRYIRKYYEKIPAEEFTVTAHNHFKAYCQRILLARKYVSRFSRRYINKSLFPDIIFNSYHFTL